MVDYSKDLRPASFRGISFLSEGDDSSFARRIEAHQFPGRNEPYHEDLGADLEEFNINAVIIGDGFIARADALEAALKKAGPAQLVHPTKGNLEVIVISARRSTSTASVGEIQFSIIMQKYGGPKYPTAAANTGSSLLNLSNASFESLISDFDQYFNLDSIPDFISADAIARSASFVDNLSSVMGKVGLLTSMTSVMPTLDVLTNGFASQVTGFFQSLRDLAAPSKRPALGSFTPQTPVQATALIKALAEASDFTIADDITATTTNKAVRVKNAKSLDLIYRMSCLTSAAGACRYASFESREQALSIRDQIGSRIFTLRDQMGEVSWDQSWQGAAAVQGALNRDINSQIGRLPKTVKIGLPSPRSSLVLAHRLYGDNLSSLQTQADDIVRRNGVRHPGYISPQTLEVLINA